MYTLTHNNNDDNIETIQTFPVWGIEKVYAKAATTQAKKKRSSMEEIMAGRIYQAAQHQFQHVKL